MSRRGLCYTLQKYCMTVSNVMKYFSDRFLVDDGKFVNAAIIAAMILYTEHI